MKIKLNNFTMKNVVNHKLPNGWTLVIDDTCYDNEVKLYEGNFCWVETLTNFNKYLNKQKRDDKYPLSGTHKNSPFRRAFARTMG